MKTFDQAHPELALEVIADQITGDLEQAERLCRRARTAWLESGVFQRSFGHRESRGVIYMWMRHWAAGEAERQRRGLPLQTT